MNTDNTTAAHAAARRSRMRSVTATVEVVVTRTYHVHLLGGSARFDPDGEWADFVRDARAGIFEQVSTYTPDLVRVNGVLMTERVTERRLLPPDGRDTPTPDPADPADTTDDTDTAPERDERDTLL